MSNKLYHHRHLLLSTSRINVCRRSIGDSISSASSVESILVCRNLSLHVVDMPISLSEPYFSILCTCYSHYLPFATISFSNGSVYNSSNMFLKNSYLPYNLTIVILAAYLYLTIVFKFVNISKNNNDEINKCDFVFV